MGEPAATPMPSARELPVVARSVGPSLGAEASRPPRSTESVVRPVRESEPATASPELPVVSRSAEPVEESAPLSGFAEAITKLTAAEEVPREPGEAASHDHHAATHDHHAKRDDDHSPHAAQPAASYRSNGMRRRIDLSTEPDLPVVAPAASPAAPSGSLPVVSRSPMLAMRPRKRSGTQDRDPTETPTLGVRLTQAPLILQRTPMTERVSAPLEPAVQRVEFLPPVLAPNLRADPDPPLRTPFQLPRRPAPSLPHRPAVPTTSASSPHRATFAISRRQTGVEFPAHTR